MISDAAGGHLTSPRFTSTNSTRDQRHVKDGTIDTIRARLTTARSGIDISNMKTIASNAALYTSHQGGRWNVPFADVFPAM